MLILRKSKLKFQKPKQCKLVWKIYLKFGKCQLPVFIGNRDIILAVHWIRIIMFSKNLPKTLDEQMFVCYNNSNSLWVYVSRRKKRRCRAWRCCPISLFPFVDSDRIITVAYHRIVVRCSNSATGVGIVKKRDFGVGFVVIRFFR